MLKKVKMIQERSFFFQIVATTTNCDVKDTNYKRGKRELFGCLAILTWDFTKMPSPANNGRSL